MQYKSWHFSRFVQQHYHRLAYFLVAVLVIVMVGGIKEFVNFATIEQNTQAEILEQEYRREKIAFEKEFLIPYLWSETAKFFFLHENGVLFEEEYFIVFSDEPDASDSAVLESSNESAEETNVEESESRQQYVNQLFTDID